MIHTRDGRARFHGGDIAMRKTLVSGAMLLLGGAIAARGKTESLLFVFLRVDHKQDIAILRPMIAPDIGVQLDSGPRQLAPGTVLTCEMLPREHDAIVEGQVGKVSEIVLNCGEHKFVVKTLDFAPNRK
jgi:hypothetical protein